MTKTENNGPVFIHPVEEIFAQILDYYNIQWEYEPRTFDLEKDAEGNVTLAFKPDFYLPAQDMYIELTTLRPQLTRIKNKKIRLMNQLYPQINIKLIKRREMRDLMVKFGLFSEANALQGTNAQKTDMDK